MKKSSFLQFVCMVLAVSSLAFAPGHGATGPVDFLEIDVPNTTGRVWIHDKALVAPLAPGLFEDFSRVVTPPRNLSSGIEIARWLRDDQYGVPYDRVLYFADPGGGLGYVYYVGVVGGFVLEEGQWYRVSETGEQALWAILEEYSKPRPVDPGPPTATHVEISSLLLGSILGAACAWFLPKLRRQN
jgi:hypothetical protein